MANVIPGTNIPIPKDRTAFDKVLPFEKIFQQDLINQMAYGQVAPDIYRNQRDTLNQLGRNMASSGAYRTGHAGSRVQDVRDQYSRQLAEQQSAFTGQVKDWMTDWYNRQAQAYYKNAAGWKMPTLPSFDEYADEMGIDVNQQGAKDPQLEALKNSGWGGGYGYRSAPSPTPSRSIGFRGVTPLPRVIDSPKFDRTIRPGFGGGDEPIYRAMPIISGAYGAARPAGALSRMFGR